MASTLIVGLGGMGGRMVKRIYNRVKTSGSSGDVQFVVMDTDINDLRKIKEEYGDIHVVCTAPNGTVGAALDQNEYARDRWFPVNDGLTGKPFTEGAGQVRAVSRLALDHAISTGLMADLEKAIEKLHGLSGESMHQGMRIMIIGSNNGGTGSGLVLPVAMYIRNFLITRYQDNSAIIRAFLLEPDVIFDILTDEEERNSLRANAYATVRELDAFFRKEYSGGGSAFDHVVFNAPQPGIGDRVDYPNILPYNFVFLMDAINCEGERLNSYGDYLKHAADCIYAQSLSLISAKSNSAEDNVIRKLAASDGRSRYCGAGSSVLEYPIDSVVEYMGLKWADRSISGEWLEIDTEFEERRREDESLKISDFYLQVFGERMKSNKFYKKVAKGLIDVFDGGEDGRTRITREKAREYPDAVVEHAKAINESDLSRSSTELSRVLGALVSNPIAITEEAIQEVAEQNGTAADDILESQYDAYLELLTDYKRVVTEEIDTTANNLAQAAYAISDYDTDPLSSNKHKEYMFESVIAREVGGTTGALHPGAVRYALYTSAAELKTVLEDAEGDVTSLEARIASKFRGLEDDESDDADEKKKGGLLSKLRRKDALDENAVGEFLIIADELSTLKRLIDDLREAKVRKAFLQQALTYVNGLAAAYEGFYSYLGGQVSSIGERTNAILNDTRFNNRRGATHRYVCASRECLEAMEEECPCRADSSELPSDLCGDIYVELLRYAKLSSKLDKSKRSKDSYERSRNEIRAQSFKDLFQRTIINYWTERVLNPSSGYPQQLDKNILKAIVDEARYTSDLEFASEKAIIEAGKAAVADTLDRGFHLAAPFIEPPVGEIPRNFKTCAYSEEILKDAGAYYEVLTKRLSEYNGVAFKDSQFSKYSIMFYRSVYGFCATNLPKYAPKHDGLQNMPEGEYRRSYYALVNQLSPNLKENSLITPHIDKNWHLIAALPELNDRAEREIHDDIVHAFLYGLVFQEFSSDQVSAGDDIFYLSGTSKQPRTELWVSNSTPCDRFYEVFDALKYSPKAVKMLLDRSEARMIRERNNTVGLSIESCKLVKAIRSKAFTTRFEGEGDKVVSAVKALAQHRAELAAREEEQELQPVFIDNKSLVTNMFGQGDASMPRRSLLEIPLYYRISLPHSETRDGEIEAMVECLFDTCQAHLANFCEPVDLLNKCGQLFEEQYILFEGNLVELEKTMPGIYSNRVVNVVREKTLSYVESIDSRYERVKDLQNKLKEAWNGMRL